LLLKDLESFDHFSCAGGIVCKSWIEIPWIFVQFLRYSAEDHAFEKIEVSLQEIRIFLVHRLLFFCKVFPSSETSDIQHFWGARLHFWNRQFLAERGSCLGSNNL
jgi:hypothetical protein